MLIIEFKETEALIIGQQDKAEAIRKIDAISNRMANSCALAQYLIANPDSDVETVIKAFTKDQPVTEQSDDGIIYEVLNLRIGRMFGTYALLEESNAN